MSSLIIHALPLSTYGRTCTLALIEKGVPYELEHFPIILVHILS